MLEIRFAETVATLEDEQRPQAVFRAAQARRAASRTHSRAGHSRRTPSSSDFVSISCLSIICKEQVRPTPVPPPGKSPDTMLSLSAGARQFGPITVPNIRGCLPVVRLTMNQSKTAFLPGFWPIRCANCGPGLGIHSACERACCTISTKTLRVSAGLLTSRTNVMRAPRMPS